jgi:predicted membrane protein
MGRGKLFTYTIIFLVLLLSFLRFLNIAGGRTFNLQLIGFAFLLLLMLLGYVGYSKWGERSFFFFFVLYMANLIALWYFFKTIYITLLFVALIGFFMSYPKREHEIFGESKPKENKEEVPKVEIITDESPSLIKKTVKKISKTTVRKPSSKKVTAVHTPGKFVASSNSNVYHLPKCDWAKRIKKARRVWFDTKKSAQGKGYRAHGCAK